MGNIDIKELEKKVKEADKLLYSFEPITRKEAFEKVGITEEQYISEKKKR